MTSLVRIIATLAVVTGAIAAAPAGDAGTALRTSVLGAMAATTSFQVDVSNPQGINGTIVLETQSSHAKVQGTAGPHSLLVYVFDGYAYQQIDNTAWQRRKLPAGAFSIAALGATASVTPEPDTSAGGAFRAVMPLSVPGVGTIPNVTLECAYDKATLLLRTCTSPFASFAFHDYNAAKNAVVLPAEAKNAKDGPPLAPAGSGL